MSTSAGFTTLRSFLPLLAKAMNLVSPDVERHHEQTAYLSLFLARTMNMPEEDVITTMHAALLHDIGGIVSEVPQIEEIERNAREVSVVSANMLAEVPGFEDVATVVSYCQSNWSKVVAPAIEAGALSERLGQMASVVHLADAVAVMLKPSERVLNQSKQILDVARRFSGNEFCSEVVSAFEMISNLEYVWMDLVLNPLFLTYFTGDIATLSLQETIGLAGFMSRIIDYRSPFTAMHSAGVAASAHRLAMLAGLGEERSLEMAIAGSLHDVGKLAVPRAILEKPGRLTDEEFNIIKEHPYYTSLVLMDIDGFENIRDWTMKHHEKLDGSGYPFHFTAADMGVEARIMAIADIFSAITEERPYRAGMTREKAAEVLQADVRNDKICGDIVALLIDNYDLVDAARDQASHVAGKRYFESIEQ